jgi:Zn-finger protein
MAGYGEWFESHAKKHRAIVEKLLKRGFSKEEIIDYFDFDNMVEAEPDFCPLYAKKQKCHAMEKLNCYLCSCPHFRFSDSGIRTEEGMTVYSECAIDSKKGKPGRFGGAIHQDCSACTIPHRRKFIEKVFDIDWKKIMAKCRLE